MILAYIGCLGRQLSERARRARGVLLAGRRNDDPSAEAEVRAETEARAEAEAGAGAGHSVRGERTSPDS